MIQTKKKRIVILGVGFGGVYCYKELRKCSKKRNDIEIIIVNRFDHFLFTPLLHEIATGSLMLPNIIEPLRKIVRSNKGQLHVSVVKSIDTIKKVVRTSGEDISYDYLVVAVGSTTNFFGIHSAERYSFTLKSAKEAIELKRHIIDVFEQALSIHNEREFEKTLRFVVIGGGATGVELAAELADYVYGTLASKYARSIAAKVKVTLIHSEDTLVPAFPKKFGSTALRVLEKRGVEVLLDSCVTEVGRDFIKLDDGEKIETLTSVWVAGVSPNIAHFTKAVTKKQGKLVVNQFLQLTDFPEIFALGDCSLFKSPDEKEPVPALAQAAVKEGESAARNILRLIDGKKLQPFVYKSSGLLLTLGRMMAVGQIGNFFFSGRLAWFFLHSVYLSKQITFTKKMKVAFHWFIALFSERDISKF